MTLTSCIPWAWNPAMRLATWLFTGGRSKPGVAGVGLARAASRFWNFTSRQSPAATRRTSGRGRLSGRSVTLPATQAAPQGESEPLLDHVPPQRVHDAVHVLCAQPVVHERLVEDDDVGGDGAGAGDRAPRLERRRQGERHRCLRHERDDGAASDARSDPLRSDLLHGVPLPRASPVASVFSSPSSPAPPRSAPEGTRTGSLHFHRQGPLHPGDRARRPVFEVTAVVGQVAETRQVNAFGVQDWWLDNSPRTPSTRRGSRG